MERQSNDIGSQLRLLREREGFTQEELATLAGSDKSYISRIESGRVSPRVRNLQKLAAYLGARVELVTGESSSQLKVINAAILKCVGAYPERVSEVESVDVSITFFETGERQIGCTLIRQDGICEAVVGGQKPCIHKFPK